MATQRSDLSPCPSCNCSGGCGCPCPTTPLTPAPSAASTTAAADYLFNGGAPGGENFDLERSLQGKGVAFATIALAAPIGSTSLSLSSTTGLKAGQPLFLTANGTVVFGLTGSGFEEVYVADTFVPGSLNVPLDSPTLNVHSAGDVLAYDAFTTTGPGVLALLPDALEAVVPALFDPTTGLQYLERSATTDGALGRNTQLVAPGLMNGAIGAQIDRARSQSDANTTAMQTLPMTGVQLTNVPAGWTATNVQTNAQATITRAANATGRHVLTSLSASIAAGATAQTPLAVVVRDGATGVGTVLWEGVLSAPVDGAASISQSGLAIAGTLNTAMTIEFTGASAAAVMAAVNMSGYDIA